MDGKQEPLDEPTRSHSARVEGSPARRAPGESRRGFRSPLAWLLAICVAQWPSLRPLPGADWPQFRGPNASGVAAAAPGERYPSRLDPGSNLVWRTPLPPGISSPCVVGQRIFLTGVRGEKLVTLALDRSSGKSLWEREAPATRTEEVHQIGSPATSTPACDRSSLYVFFGSLGLISYDLEGNVRWTVPLGPFKNNYGQASSPVLWKDSVLLNCDQDVGSFLLSVAAATGKERWRTDRRGFPRGFSTPVFWNDRGSDELLVAGTLRLVAYDPATGRELWSRGGLARIVNSTPVLGGGTLFVSSFAPGGDPDDRIAMPSFSSFLKENDRDADGLLARSELPEGPFLQRFPQLDADKNGKITQPEWEEMRQIFASAVNSIFALAPGREGNPAEVPILWRHERAIPYVASPLYLDGLIYLLKDGAIFTCLDASSGKVEKQARLPAPGNYYASPVAGGGWIYTAGRDGGVCVVRPGRQWEVAWSGDLREAIMATPALVEGKVYLRTETALYAFEEK